LPAASTVGAELPERHPRGRFHDQVGAEHQLVERIGGIAGAVAGSRTVTPGQRHRRDVAARRLATALPMTPMPTMPT
jgi:hypothetical protein